MATNNQLLNRPPLRFPEFNDEWERTTLGEILEFFPTNSLSWEQLTYSTGNIYNIHYGLIHKGLSIICSPTLSRLPYIGDGIETKKYSFCKSGDLVIADASEDTCDVGKTIELVDCDEVKVLAGLHTIHARSSMNKTAIGFKGYLFASNNLKEQIKRVAQGTKVYSISSKLISPLRISLPSLPEQQKIASFLSLLDERIEAQRQTIKEHKKQKKALLQQIFSQSLRFPGFADEWQQTTLGEICKVSTGEMNTQDRVEDGKYPFYVRSSKIERANRYTYDGVSILTPGDGAIGQIFHYSEGKIAVHQRVYMLTEMRCIPKYLFHYFSARFFERVSRMSAKNTVDSVRMNMITDMPLSLPSLEEQKKIAELFTIFDERIEVEEALLTCYEAQKRYLLRQMFV